MPILIRKLAWSLLVIVCSEGHFLTPTTLVYTVAMS